MIFTTHAESKKASSATPAEGTGALRDGPSMAVDTTSTSLEAVKTYRPDMGSVADSTAKQTTGVFMKLSALALS
jgi:hypothetical protein